MSETANFIGGPICGQQGHRIAQPLPTIVWQDELRGLVGHYDRLGYDAPDWLVTTSEPGRPFYVWRPLLHPAGAP